MVEGIGAWEIVKAVLQYAVYPLVGAVGFIMKKHIERIDAVEKDLNETKTRTSVIESKVDDIRDDIKDIKRNVEKLVDRK